MTAEEFLALPSYLREVEPSMQAACRSLKPGTIQPFHATRRQVDRRASFEK